MVSKVGSRPKRGCKSTRQKPERKQKVPQKRQKGTKNPQPTELPPKRARKVLNKKEREDLSDYLYFYFVLTVMANHVADNAGTFSFIFVFAELYFSVTSPRRAHSLALYRIIASTRCGYFTNGHKTNVLKSLHQYL